MIVVDNLRRYILIGGLFIWGLLIGNGLQAQPIVRSGEVDVFMGVDLNYRDIFYDKPYELLVNLTPGVKWNMGRQWQVAAQAGWTASTPARWTALAGADVYLSRWNTQLRLRGGRFVYEDYGDVSISVRTSNRQHTGGSN